MAFFKRNKERVNITSEEMHKLVRQEEPNANIAIAGVLFVIAFCYLVAWLLFKAAVFTTSLHMEDYTLLPSGVLLVLFSIVCFLRDGRGVWLKYAMFVILMLSMLAVNVAVGYKAWMLYAVPVILGCRYTNVRFTVVVGIFSALFVVATCLCNVYVSPSLSLVDLNTVRVPHAVAIATGGSFFDAVDAMVIEPDSLFEGTLHLSLAPNLIIIICVVSAAIAVTRNNQQLMVRAAENAKAKAEMEIEVEKGRSRLMISQIQPHFLYNTLSAIMAIDGNPNETVDAIGDFGKYLRENLNSLTSEDLTPLAKEMEHVKRYVSLEQLRFEDKVAVDYDVQAEDFCLPPLTVQVLVENAVKHGISKKPEGGHIAVSTGETLEYWEVQVEDDGLGFDTSVHIDEAEHVGLFNVRSRLKSLCNGSLNIQSAPGEGTVATIRIPKTPAAEEE